MKILIYVGGVRVLYYSRGLLDVKLKVLRMFRRRFSEWARAL